MHIENFKIFSDLVESESFSRAAKLNGVTQSAVSQQLRSMEKHFSVLIVDRSQKQFKLTREGEKLYDGSKEILIRFQKLQSELQEMKKVISGSIHISTVTSIGLHELPPYIKKFLKEFPSVNIRIEYRRSNFVYEDILQNSVDLGLVAFPVKMRQIEIIPFCEDKLTLVCSSESELANRKEISLSEIANYDLIGFDPDIPTRKATDILFKEQKIEIDPIMEFDNIETVKRAVEINAGVAILPLATVLNEVQQGLLKTVRIKGKQIKRPLAIIIRKGRILSPAIKKFIANLTGKPFKELTKKVVATKITTEEKAAEENS